MRPRTTEPPTSRVRAASPQPDGAADAPRRSRSRPRLPCPCEHECGRRPVRADAPARRHLRDWPRRPLPTAESDRCEGPAFPAKEEPVLAGFELTPTAPLDEDRHTGRTAPRSRSTRRGGRRPRAQVSRRSRAIDPTTAVVFRPARDAPLLWRHLNRPAGASVMRRGFARAAPLAFGRSRDERCLTPVVEASGTIDQEGMRLRGRLLPSRTETGPASVPG